MKNKKLLFSDEFIYEMSNEKFRTWKDILIYVEQNHLFIDENLIVKVTDPKINNFEAYKIISSCFPKITFQDNLYCLNRFFSFLRNEHSNNWAPKRDRDLIHQYFSISDRIIGSVKHQFSKEPTEEIISSIQQIESLINSCPKNKLNSAIEMVEKLFKILPEGTIINFDILKLYDDTKSFYEAYLEEKKK